MSMHDEAFPPAPGPAGLSKLEYACIHLRIPATGDPDLNAIIAQAQRRDVAVKIAAGLMTTAEGQVSGKDEERRVSEILARYGVQFADVLTAAMAEERPACAPPSDHPQEWKTSTVFVVPAGWSPQKAAQVMLEIAMVREEDVACSYNGTELRARTGMNVAQVLEPLAARMYPPTDVR